jgi:hypothetical protein
MNEAPPPLIRVALLHPVGNSAKSAISNGALKRTMYLDPDCERD